MYQGFDALLKGFGDNRTSDDLMKALYSTNSGSGGITQGPLTLENLDGTMTEVLTGPNHFKLWQKIPVVPSANAYYEFNKHTGFGARRSGLGFAEGGGPTGNVSAFTRAGEYVKYLGVRGGVTDQMLRASQAGGIFEDAEARENKDRTLELLERFERDGVFGDKGILDKNGVEVGFDGLLAQMVAKNAANVIDMQGKAFGFDNIDNSSENLIVTGKQPSMDGYGVLMSPHVAKGLNKQYIDRNIVRLDKGSNATADVSPGFRVPSYDGQFGSVTFDHSILLQEVEGAGALAVAHPDAPAAAPVFGIQPVVSGAVGPIAATYTYAVAAFNDAGETVATSAAAGLALNGNQGATFTITKCTGATGYRVYRKTAAVGSAFRLIAKVKAPATGADVTGATVTGNTYKSTEAAGALYFIDTGAWVPTNATDSNATDGLAIFIKPEPRDICIAQLAPLHKKVLPAQDTLNPFILMLYATLVVKAPERIRIYKNCGKYVDGTSLDGSK